MPTNPHGSGPQSRPKAIDSRQLGRRISSGLYYVLVTTIAIASLIQVSRQVYFDQPTSAKSPYPSCVEGLSALYQAVNRGRLAAAESGTEQGSNRNAEQGLIRYRREVNATWKYHDQVAQLCGRNNHLRQTLDALERLRYSEEHGVRYQAAELEPLRRRVRSLVAQSLDQRPPR